jgi:predicted O-linked N-acetylglucosamine transferase (SPINDLY family)
VDHWRSTLGVNDETLAEWVQRDGVDILVDLTQHMDGNRLTMFCHRPAPVQVSFAGYPAGTGVEAIPYRISDRWLESQIGSAERIYLIDSYWCCDPCGAKIDVNELPAERNGWVTFGCLNNFCKVNEPTLRRWAKVLGRVRDSRLILLSPEGSHRQRAWQILESEGVATRRVEFVPRCTRRAYLELYQRLDVALDTFPYNGHTTSLDALWMGVPVVSLAGESAVSRAGLSQLTNLGVPEFVAHAENDYVAIATELAGDLPRLAELRETLRPRMEASVLMDAVRFTRGIENAYREMWRRWCEG